jgi:hypothetical protein
MLTKEKSILTEKVLKIIPSNIKPVEYLMELLELSKESAYRRLRGDIPFTFDEVVKLSMDLGFSIDELIIENNEGRVFFGMDSLASSNPSKSFLNLLNDYHRDILTLNKTRNGEALITANRISEVFTAFFDKLFKFSYFKWIHQACETSMTTSYSDLIIPEEILEAQKKIKTGTPNCNKSTFIVDSNLFTNMIKEIAFYHKRKFINAEELLELKDELMNYLRMIEKIAQTGTGYSGSKYDIYLSSVNIGANSSYLNYGDHEVSRFYTHSHNPIITNDPRICSAHKRRIESLKKYTTLISLSNEILQTKYFEQQRTEIENLKWTTI